MLKPPFQSPQVILSQSRPRRAARHCNLQTLSKPGLHPAIASYISSVRRRPIPRTTRRGTSLFPPAASKLPANPKFSARLAASNQASFQQYPPSGSVFVTFPLGGPQTLQFQQHAWTCPVASDIAGTSCRCAAVFPQPGHAFHGRSHTVSPAPAGADPGR